MKKKLIAFTLLSPMPGHGGWGNGYVALPKSHPCFGMDYDAIHNKYKSINVNGGLTFASSDIPGQPDETKGMWIVGFDTLHYGDTPSKWPSEQSILDEALRLEKQLITIAKRSRKKKK